MKSLLRAIALLSLTANMAQAAPLAFTPSDVSSIVLIQRGYRPPPPTPHPEIPHPLELPSGHFDLRRPHDFDPTRPGPDLVVDGGAVKTLQELEQENNNKRRDCASSPDGTRPDYCDARSAPVR